LAAVKAGIDCPTDQLPKVDSEDRPRVDSALADLLRVLLKAKSEGTGVAARLIASASDLDAIAGGARDVVALTGWRAEVFGHDALRLCNGEIALTAHGQDVGIIAL
jgi:ribonuclease D